MKIEKFEPAVKEVKEKFGINAMITTDICKFCRCKNKSRWHRVFHNLSYNRHQYGTTNIITNNIWVNPSFIKWGSPQLVKNLLAHEFAHLSRFKITKNFRDKRKKEGEKATKELVKVMEKREKKEVKGMITKEEFKVAEKLITEILKVGIHNLDEEVMCNKIANKLYPINLEERRRLGTKIFFLHPIFFKNIFEALFLGYLSLKFLTFMFEMSLILGLLALPAWFYMGYWYFILRHY